MSEGQAAHGPSHPALTTWLKEIDRDADDKPSTDTHRQILHAERAVELYSRALDGPGPVAHKLVAILRSLRSEIERLPQPPDDEALVGHFAQSLPPLVRNLLKERFGFTQVGDKSTAAIASALRKRELADLRLIGLVDPLVNFNLAPSPRPETEEAKLRVLDGQRPGRDRVPWQGGFGNLSRIKRGETGRTLRQNMIEGTAYERRRRRTTEVESDQGREEEERVTILLVDGSPSMTDFDEGVRARFQDALAADFIAKAAADVTPSGRPRHRVMIIPF